MKIKYCGTCSLAPQGVCQLYNQKINPKTDFCSHHTTELHKCVKCGLIVLSGGIFDEGKLFCDKCFSECGTCATCINQSSCEFKTNPSTIPLYIPKQVRNGNMTMQTQIPNPERIKTFCTDCKCYSDAECWKENGNTCGNYQRREY